MKIFLLILLLLMALSEIFCQNFSPEEEDKWKSDRYPGKVNLLESDLQTMLERVSRAPGLQPVFSLMRKKSTAKSQITQRRQKFQTFVGLMGKRNAAETGSF
ncbi:hypothetical protein QQF64_009256 [Cirrhinus molitorella]|uniref:Uncharacterized protein n=2 Tax=Cirrhinus molitorella TaxID=172907 RepID=A0AA88Q456_9TELE|nr:hypothetical protein Q8A67_008303 [Cirrhinus molitorella]